MSKALSQSKRRLKSAGITRWLFMGGCLLVAQGATAQELVSVSTTQHYANKYQPARVAPMQAQSLKLVLTELEQRYQVRFIYESDLIDQKQMSTLVSEGKTLVQCLDQLLTPLNLSYQKLDNHTYGIIKKASKEEDGQSAVGNQLELSLPNVPMQELRSTQIAEMMNSTQLTAITVTGKVTDEKGEGIPGVNVVLKGTTTGTSTNMEGAYSLVVPDGSENGTLIFSYIGYLTEEVAISNRTTVNSELTPDIKALSEVVVVGYGSQKKADLTGSVAIVQADEIKKVAASDLTQLLQGRAAGVTVNSDGQPGASPVVRIRGVSTFGDAAPLYVIDGVPLNGSPRDFNPNDIASMQVLKDASAGAIYGSRAANGVIIITTKQGKKNSPLRVEYNGYYGVDQVWQRMPVTDRVNYQMLNNEARANGRLQDPTVRIAPGNDPTSPLYINNIDTDWQKEGLKLGSRQNHGLNFSGGGTNTTYNVSVDYFGNKGTYEGNGPSYDRYSTRVNTTAEKGIFKIGQSIYYAHSKENQLTYRGDILLGAQPPIINNLVTAIPTMAVYDPNNEGGFGGTLSDVHDVISLNGIGVNSLMKNYVDVDRIFGNLYGEVELLKGLKYKLNLSYDRTLTRDFAFQPEFNLGYFFRQTTARLDDNSRVITTGLVENTLNYEKTFDRHHLALLVGQMYQEGGFVTRTGHAEGFNKPYYTTLSNGKLTTAGGTESHNTLASFLGRLNYNFDERYLLQATIRRDGSSRFAPSNKFGYYPSVSLGWRVNNEGFFKVPKSIISDLKIRASYGQLGNQNIGDYLYLAFINPNIVANFGDTRAIGGLQTSVVNEDIRWETKTTSNVGFDAVLLNGMFDFTAEYYSSKTTDILVGVPIPASVGSINRNVIVNAGSLRNSGLEFLATYHKSQGEFTFDISANVTTIKNKVLALGGKDDPIYGVGSKTQVGSEIGQHFGWEYEGIFQTQDEVTNHAFQYPQTAPGDIKFKDQLTVDTDGDGKPDKGDGVIDDKDRVYLGSGIPKVNYGLNFTAGYKGFDFTLFASGSGGHKINGRIYRELMHTGGSINYHEDILDRWTPTHTDTDIPRLQVNDPNQNGRDSNRPGWLQNGTYLRLNTISLGYTLPTGIVKGLAKARVYLTAQNLYTFQKYKGYNPDFTSGVFEPGFDNGSYPKPRTIMLGVQLGF